VGREGAGVKVICTRTGKQVYGTRARAIKYAIRAARQTGQPYRIYRCPHCDWWHLTSQNRRAA
jgi:hypothetical protein